jgi:hypothetical protein
MLGEKWRGRGWKYLVLVEHCAEGVEELKRRDNLALYERGCEDCGGCPPAGAQRHFPEPSLEGEAGLRSHCAHLVHVHVARLVLDMDLLLS